MGAQRDRSFRVTLQPVPEPVRLERDFLLKTPDTPGRKHRNKAPFDRFLGQGSWVPVADRVTTGSSPLAG